MRITPKHAFPCLVFTSLGRSLPVYSLRRIKERIPPPFRAPKRPSANDTPVIIPPIGQTTNLINPLPSRRHNDFPRRLFVHYSACMPHSHPDLQVVDGVVCFCGTRFPNAYLIVKATSRSLELHSRQLISSAVALCVIPPHFKFIISLALPLVGTTSGTVARTHRYLAMTTRNMKAKIGCGGGEGPGRGGGPWMNIATSQDGDKLGPNYTNSHLDAADT